MGHCKTCKAPHKMPPAGNGLEALYSNVVQQLEQLQLQHLRKTMKQYLQSTQVKGWMRRNRPKSVQMKNPAPHKDPRIDNIKVQEQLNQQNHRHGLQSYFVNSECQAFPKCSNQEVENIGYRSKRNILDPSRQQKRVREFGLVAMKTTSIPPKSASSNRKVDRLFNEPGNSQWSVTSPRLPQSSSEIGRFRKSVETSNTYRSSRATTTVGCETLATTRRSSNTSAKGKPRSPQPLSPIQRTECSSTFFHIRDLTYDYEGPSPPTKKLEIRPASMTLRRQYNCNTLIEEVKSQRALDAKLELRRRERLNAQIVNAPVTTVILRSNEQPSVSNRSMNETMTGALTNEDRRIFRNVTSCSETPTRNYLPGKRFGLQENADCNGTTRPSYQIGRDLSNSRSTLDSTLTQKSRPLATASRTTAILQDALEALECAHRWNEWGARTLHQLARASKAAVERNHSLPGWTRINEPKKPEILLPHDNDVVTSTRRGRILESREEERVFTRDLLVTSVLTNGDWVDKPLLDARQQVVKRTQTSHYRRHKQQEEFSVPGDIPFERRKKNVREEKLLDQRILHDFVEKLMKHELVLRRCAQPGTNLTALIHEHERKGQALMQKVWNQFQMYPSPASDDICTTVQHVLQRDLKALDPTWVEVAEVVRELEKMIYENLVQELLEELEQVAVFGDCVQNQTYGWHTCTNATI